MARSLAARSAPLASAGALIFAVLGWSARASAQTLAPPAPMDSSTPSAAEQSTTYRLDEAERADSKRKFELFWVNADAGGTYMNLSQLSSDSLAVEKAASGGPSFSLGAGVRLVIFTLGVRARYHHLLSAYNMWQLNGEAGLKIPIGKLDFAFGFHGGYSFVGNLADAAVATNTATPTNADAVKVRGFNVGLDLGLDYYVTPIFSVGAAVFADFLFLKRPALDKPGGLTAEQSAALDADPLYQQSGTSAGFGVGGGLRLGLHFGL